MGLLSRAGRGVGRFIDGASERMGDRADPRNFSGDRFAPLTSAAYGGIAGAGMGAAANPSDPGMGALAGAGMGAAGGAGLSLARQGAAGVRAGMQAMGGEGAQIGRLREGLMQAFPNDAQTIMAMSDDEVLQMASRMGAPGETKSWLR